MYDFIAIDFETANDNLFSACSIGIVAVKDSKIINKEYLLIKPPFNKFSARNISIHGIKPEDVINEDTFDLVWDKIQNYFSYPIVAHNSQFDMSVLWNCLNYYAIPLPEFIYFDSICVARCTGTYCGSNSLESVSNELEIPLCDHHDALCDAEACANIVINIMNSENIFNFNWFFAMYNTGAKLFSRIKPNKSFMKKIKNQEFKYSELDAPDCNADSNNPLYGKNCVLTGELKSLERKDAIDLLLSKGAFVKSGVTGKTDYLIVGVQDLSIVGDDGMSGKEEKAYQLIEAGKIIKIIKEEEFITMLTL